MLLALVMTGSSSLADMLLLSAVIKGPSTLVYVLLASVLKEQSTWEDMVTVSVVKGLSTLLDVGLPSKSIYLSIYLSFFRTITMFFSFIFFYFYCCSFFSFIAREIYYNVPRKGNKVIKLLKSKVISKVYISRDF